jgi:Restriction endonuclease
MQLGGACLLSVRVTKANGSTQLFDKEKVIRTCLRFGASRQTAYEIADKVERRLYEGIPTAKILQMTLWFLRKYKPAVSQLFDLRKGLSLMNSKPEFEIFVQALLDANGFEVSPNRIISGKCVEHEVDAVAKKNGITYIVEAKHHVNYHTQTGLDESRIARATLEDLTEGFALGDNDLKVDRAMIVTNTRYSEQAIRYGMCRNILQIGWNSPVNLSVQSMIEEKNLYPLSCLKSLKWDARMNLVNSGTLLIKQLVEEDTAKLSKESGLSMETLRRIKETIDPEAFLFGSLR